MDTMIGTPAQTPMGREYVNPNMIYTNHNNYEDYENYPDNHICDAIYNVPGPFPIKESYTPINIINDKYNFNNIDDLGNLALCATFNDVQVRKAKLTMEVLDYLYHDSLSGPFAEQWFRDPETYLEGTGEVVINFHKTDPETLESTQKEITFYNIKVRGTLISKPEGLEWLIGVDSKNLFLQLKLLLDSFYTINDSLPSYTEEQKDKFNDLEYYYNIIKSHSLEKSRQFVDSQELPSTFGNIY